MKNNLTLCRLLSGAAFTFILASPPAFAQQQAGPDLTSVDIKSLLNMDITTASRFQEKASDAPGIVEVVTSDELRRFGGLTLSEILQRVPGFTQSSQNIADRTLVAVRGDQTTTNGGHILFLINGRPTREVMEGGVIGDLLQSFPVEVLDRIEIIKGPGSVMYGSNAFTAVVNLIVRKAEGTQGSVLATGGANGARFSAAEGTYKSRNFSMVAAGRIHTAPDWPMIYNVSPPTNPFGPHVPPVENITVIDRGAGGYLGMDFKGLNLMSSFTEAESSSFVQGDIGETRLTRAFGNLGYHHRVSTKWNMEFNFTVTRTTFSAVQFPHIKRDANEMVAEWTNLIRLSSKDRLTVGTLFNRIEGREVITSSTPNVPDADGSRPGGAFYAQLDHQLRDDLKLIAGFQTNKIGSLSLDTAPRGGMIWNPLSWASVKALYGQAFRAPSLDEMLLNHPGLAGNPNLLPEQIGTLDLGLTVRGNNLEASLDYFHSRESSSILSVAGPTGRGQYVNQGVINYDGFELGTKYYLHRNFFLQGSVNYQTNVSNTGATNVTPIPNWGFKTGISYERRHGLTLGLFDVISGGVVNDASNLNPIENPHGILDAQARYDLKKYLPIGEKGGLALVVHANNLMDHGVWLRGWGFNANQTVPAEQGRVVYAGIEFTAGRN